MEPLPTTDGGQAAPPVTPPLHIADIYLIAAHPAWRESRVNRLLMEAAQSLPRVEVRDLYSTYPDYAMDVAREQAALARAQLVVLVHPIHWYSMPALQKLWMDEVLAYGWAYGEEGTALRGKDLWLVATTGGPDDSYSPDGYNRYFFDAFMPPYEQTATVCGMRFLPPMVLHAAHAISREDVQAHVDTFRQRLQSYPNWPEMDELTPCVNCVVPADDRPAPDFPDIFNQPVRKPNLIGANEKQGVLPDTNAALQAAIPTDINHPGAR